MQKPIFIIGLHRTGSTLLKNMFNLNPDVGMAPDEMHFSTPWHKDFLSYFKRAGSLRNDHILRNFLNTLFSDKLYGSFWKELNHTQIDKRRVFERIYASDYSPRDILTIILEEYAISEGKSRFGAKYPLHFSRLGILFDWWPDCKVIHLVRDPRAICASKVNDEATKLRKNNHKLFSHFIHLGTQLFFVSEFLWSCRIDTQYKYKRNYLKVRFEDLVTNPVHYVKEMCNFCELEYDAAMMHPIGKPSSHDGRKRCGFDKLVLTRWEKALSPFETKWITYLTKNSMKRLGYGNIEWSR